jgi:hypothetical protein
MALIITASNNHEKNGPLNFEKLCSKNLKASKHDLEKARTSKWSHAEGKKQFFQKLKHRFKSSSNRKDDNGPLSWLRAFVVGETLWKVITDVINGHQKKREPKFDVSEEAVQIFAGPVWAVQLYNKEHNLIGTPEQITDISQIPVTNQSTWL